MPPELDPPTGQSTGSAPASQEGDVPCVRELLLAHFRNPYLEVEGKLGHRTDRSDFRDRFTAGVSARQFEQLETRLCEGAAFLGLPAGELPALEVTLDRFVLHPDDPRRRQNWRLSYTCDGSGRPAGEPFESLHKTRISDCHVASTPSADSDVSSPPRPPAVRPVAIRVSFSEEAPDSPGGAPPVLQERLKRRRTWKSPLFHIQLTRVEMEGRQSFEVEVELQMEVVRARLEDASGRAEQARLVARELSAALRGLAAWAAEVPRERKRKRLEDFHGALPTIKATLERPEVSEELHRLVSEGPGTLHKAKRYLHGVLEKQCPAVEEGVLLRFAGQQVARALMHQKHQNKAPLTATAA